MTTKIIQISQRKQPAECTYPQVQVDMRKLETQVAAKMAGVRVCACGCGRSLEGRAKRCAYYEDKCRAKGFHTRRTANNPAPTKRTSKPVRPTTPRKVTAKACRSEPEPAPANPAPDPRPIKKREQTKKEKVVYDAEARRQTEEHNNIISWSLTEQSSYCKRCRRPGGGRSEKGGAGPLKTKMGVPGSLCKTCWGQVYPEEGF